MPVQPPLQILPLTITDAPAAVITTDLNKSEICPGRNIGIARERNIYIISMEYRCDNAQHYQSKKPVNIALPLRLQMDVN